MAATQEDNFVNNINGSDNDASANVNNSVDTPDCDDCNGTPGNPETESGDEKSKDEKRGSEKESRRDISHKKEIEKYKKDFDELNDRYLRMMAEYDNFRKRAQKERESAYSDAFADAVGQLLPVLDNLERACSFSDSESVTQGISMIVKSFNEILGKIGVNEIKTSDTPFNPELHNAVMHTEDPGRGEGEIVEVLQKGYEYNGRVIRYAMVKVAN